MLGAMVFWMSRATLWLGDHLNYLIASKGCEARAHEQPRLDRTWAKTSRSRMSRDTRK